MKPASCLELLSLLFVLFAATDARTQPLPPLECNRESLAFTSGRFHLAGDLLSPRGNGAHPVIVYVWGAGPTNRQRHIERSPALRAFLDEGYAVLLYDKPGSGGSTGEIDPRHQFQELSSILIDAIGTLKTRDAINPRAIGLYGSSQASYVMATALARKSDVAFVVAWSCPMQNSIEQGSFLVRNYVLCDGGSFALADTAGAAYRRRARARSYTDYHAAAEALDGIAAIRDGLGWAGVRPESEFTPADSTSESFFDPAPVFSSLKIPVLALYAEHDRQIDPVQGADMFRSIFAGDGHALSLVEVVPDSDHNMILSPRGCMQDQADDYKAVGGRTMSPVFLETMRRWLKSLKNSIEP